MVLGGLWGASRGGLLDFNENPRLKTGSGDQLARVEEGSAQDRHRVEEGLSTIGRGANSSLQSFSVPRENLNHFYDQRHYLYDLMGQSTSDVWFRHKA